MDRDNTGRFTSQNKSAETHGLHAFQTRGEAPLDVLDQVERFRRALIADQGGPDELSTVRNGYVQHLSGAHGCLLLLATDLQTRGLFTQRGRVRSTFLVYLQTLDRWDRLAQRLGMSRRQRPVPDLESFLAERKAGT